MSHRKKNISRWALPMLLLLLTVGCLVASTGGAFARYRAEEKLTLYFTARPPEQVVLGKMVTATVKAEDGTETETVVFDPTAQGVWETVEEKQQLEFTVANGTGTEEGDFAQENQRISLRLIGSLGIWDGNNEKFKLSLQLPLEEGEDAPKTVEAEATRIQKGSPMYATFGEGWVFAFFDEDGEELSWLLEGGALNTVTLTLILEGVAENEASLLQLQISGIYAEE